MRAPGSMRARTSKRASTSRHPAGDVSPVAELGEFKAATAMSHRKTTSVVASTARAARATGRNGRAEVRAVPEDRGVAGQGLDGDPGGAAHRQQGRCTLKPRGVLGQVGRLSLVDPYPIRAVAESDPNSRATSWN